MGDPTSTTTMMLHAFQARYAEFRDELSRLERALFDEAYADCFNHSTALNRRPGIDSERPIFLAMLLAEKARRLALERQVAQLRGTVNALAALLEDEYGTRLPVVRGNRPNRVELDRLGQARLPHYPQAHPVPGELPGRTPTPFAKRG